MLRFFRPGGRAWWLADPMQNLCGRARAPCVVLTEIDFDTLDESAVRRIFVGATRATMKLTLLVSEASAKVLLDKLSDGESGQT